MRQVLEDRQSDRPLRAARDDRPPLVTRATLRGLCVLCLVVIVYGTLGPLGLGGGPWLRSAPDWQVLPPWKPSGFDDVFANLLIYVPVGVAFRLLVRRRGCAGLPDFLIGMVAAAALSYLTEVCQQFMPARSASLQDVGFNALGAFAGCLAAPRVQWWLRLTHVRAFEVGRSDMWALLAWVTAIVTWGLMVVPLHPAWPHWEVMLVRPLDIEDLRRFGMFVLIGFCLTAAAIQRLGNHGGAVRAAMAPAFLLAILFETSQLFVATHTCGVLDIVIAMLGAVTGCAAATMSADFGIIYDGSGNAAPSSSGRRRSLSVFALLGTALVIGAFSVEQATLVSNVPLGERLIYWTPFQTHFLRPFHVAVARICQTTALYAFLALLALLATRGSGRAVALLLVTGLSTLIEALRLLGGTGVADVTPIVLAVAGWWVTLFGWDVITPRQRAVASLPSSPRA